MLFTNETPLSITLLPTLTFSCKDEQDEDERDEDEQGRVRGIKSYERAVAAVDDVAGSNEGDCMRLFRVTPEWSEISNHL